MKVIIFQMFQSLGIFLSYIHMLFCYLRVSLLAVNLAVFSDKIVSESVSVENISFEMLVVASFTFITNKCLSLCALVLSMRFLPSFWLKRQILTSLPTQKVEHRIADSIDFMVERVSM